jgi:hypothetical protein
VLVGFLLRRRLLLRMFEGKVCHDCDVWVCVYWLEVLMALRYPPEMNGPQGGNNVSPLPRPFHPGLISPEAISKTMETPLLESSKILYICQKLLSLSVLNLLPPATVRS